MHNGVWNGDRNAQVNYIQFRTLVHLMTVIFLSTVLYVMRNKNAENCK